MGVETAVIGGVAMLAGALMNQADDIDEVNIPQHKPVEAKEQFKPTNAVNWVDNAMGDKFSFVRDLEGNISVNIENDKNSEYVNSQTPYDNVDTSLPSVKDLPDFNNRYAATVAALSNKISGLHDTIEGIQNTNPELIEANRPLIDSFKRASNRAMNKNYDIKRNGLHERLKKLGLSESSTSIGVEMGLLRERTDTEIFNSLKTAKLSQELKQDTLKNYSQLTGSVVNQAGLEMDKYRTESHNELTARGQDLTQEQTVQNRAANQVNFNLQNSRNKADIALADKNRMGGMMNARNPINTATQMMLGNNANALDAINNDNQAYNAYDRNELQQAQINAGIAQNNNQNSNPIGTVLGQVGGHMAGRYIDSKLPVS